MEQRRVVAVIDDDESVRESLPDLLKVLGFAARTFTSAEEFLASDDDIANAACLLLDINMPGMSGPELQRELIRRGHVIPTIFITAQSPASVPPSLLEEMAVAFLYKPFSKKDLRAALDGALTRS